MILLTKQKNYDREQNKNIFGINTIYVKICYKIQNLTQYLMVNNLTESLFVRSWNSYIMWVQIGVSQVGSYLLKFNLF